MLRDDFPVLWPIPTRWSDNDHYGHVNNVASYSFFDTAVNGWLMQATGTDIRELPAIGLVVETSCRYVRPLSFPDPLEVGVRVERLGTSSITYVLAVFSEGHDAAASEGRFVHVYVDRGTRATVPIPEVVRRAAEGARVAGTP